MVAEKDHASAGVVGKCVRRNMCPGDTSAQDILSYRTNSPRNKCPAG